MRNQKVGLDGQLETIKVLLLEDNPGDARLIREMLLEETVASFDLTWVETHHA